MINGNTTFAGVIGWPVSHSKSPAIHNYWCQKYGINAVYLPLPVKPASLADIIRTLPEMGCVGVNLTIPHKEIVLPYLKEIDPIALAIGAVNTVLFAGNAARGFNTDAYGFWQNLITHTDLAQRNSALVIGAGGAARAVLVALKEAGFKTIYLMNRTREKALHLAPLAPITVIDWQENPTCLGEVELVVNTTSLGMTGQPPLNLDLSACKASTVVTDIVYAPLKTELLKAAEARGLIAIDGLGMLLYQAQKAFEIWFGVLPEVDAALREQILAL